MQSNEMQFLMQCNAIQYNRQVNSAQIFKIFTIIANT